MPRFFARSSICLDSQLCWAGAASPAFSFHKAFLHEWEPEPAQMFSKVVAMRACRFSPIEQLGQRLHLKALDTLPAKPIKQPPKKNISDLSPQLFC